MNEPAPATQPRPKMNPGQCDTRTTEVFRTWTTDAGMPRHKHEVGVTLLNFEGASLQDLPPHLQKFRKFLSQLEQQVKMAIRCSAGMQDHNRVVYAQFVELTSLPPNAFRALLEAQYGIELDEEDMKLLFERYGDEELGTFDLDHIVQRMIRNEASVGNWGGKRNVESEALSLPLTSRLPPTLNKRAGSVPLQGGMSDEDSKKLLPFGRTMKNFDGTLCRHNSDVTLGGTALCPDLTKRPPDQRIKRIVQKSHLGANDQYNDSRLVRGYADSWVPPVGDGAWSAEPTYCGDGEKIGSRSDGNVAPLQYAYGSTPEDLKNINKIDPPPYKLNSHNMMAAQSGTAPGMRFGEDPHDSDSVPCTPQSFRPTTAERPGTADPTGSVASKLKLKHMEHLNKQKDSQQPPPLVPSIRLTTRRSAPKLTARSCATSLSLLTDRMARKDQQLSTRRSKKSVHKFDTRKELFDLTQSTFRSTHRSYRSCR